MHASRSYASQLCTCNQSPWCTVLKEQYCLWSSSGSVAKARAGIIIKKLRVGHPVLDICHDNKQLVSHCQIQGLQGSREEADSLTHTTA